MLLTATMDIRVVDHLRWVTPTDLKVTANQVIENVPSLVKYDPDQ